MARRRSGAGREAAAGAGSAAARISAGMCAKLSEQITHEFGAELTYLAMACQFERDSLKMLAKFFRKQADEERGHALKIVDYLLEVGAVPRLEAIPAPAAEHATVLAALEAALAHEQRVTQQIHDLVALAERERDYATRSFLNWFVDEQVEEVSTMEHLVGVCRMCGPHLLQLEAYLMHFGHPEDKDD